MGSDREPTGDIIVRETLPGDESGRPAHPTVLSCGGIFIPRRSESEQKIFYQVITTSCENEPVKVVTGSRPRNVLYDVLMKESMN